MRNNLLIKIILAVAIIFAASIYLPDIFWSSFKFRANKPNVSYSPVLNDFLLSYSNVDKNKIVDRKGKVYSRDEYESLMPQLNFAQLVFAGKMLDTIKGTAVNVPLLRKNLFRSTFNPFTINRFPMMLFPLIESNPGRVNLEYPFEFFNIKTRMEIIDSKTNTLKEEMSVDFTAALEKNGFVFPAKKLFGNPTTRKAFDEGYFIIDQVDHLFHLKRVSNKPYCERIELSEGMRVSHFNVHELPLKEFYGFFVTEDDRLSLLSYNNYKIINLPIKSYDHNNSTVNIFGDFFYRTVTVTNDDKMDVFVFDRNYKLVDEYRQNIVKKHESKQGKIAAYIFPFSASLINDKSMFVNFNFEFRGLEFLVVNILLFVLLYMFLWWKKFPIMNNLFPLVLVLLGGIYGLIAVLLIRDFHQSTSDRARE